MNGYVGLREPRAILRRIETPDKAALEALCTDDSLQVSGVME
ncbi:MULTISPECIES: hypothetical protein [Myxococcus]|nr:MULTISPECIES: hypothetical protein [Myxococcus]